MELEYNQRYYYVQKSHRKKTTKTVQISEYIRSGAQSVRAHVRGAPKKKLDTEDFIVAQGVFTEIAVMRTYFGPPKKDPKHQHTTTIRHVRHFLTSIVKKQKDLKAMAPMFFDSLPIRGKIPPELNISSHDIATIAVHLQLPYHKMVHSEDYDHSFEPLVLKAASKMNRPLSPCSFLDESYDHLC